MREDRLMRQIIINSFTEMFMVQYEEGLVCEAFADLTNGIETICVFMDPIHRNVMKKVIEEVFERVGNEYYEDAQDFIDTHYPEGDGNK